MTQTPTRPASRSVRPNVHDPKGRGGIHRTLTVNSASNTLRYVVSLAIAFFLTPFVVRALGDDGYGVWVVILSFVGYASILEFGIQPAVVRMVGQHRGTGDREKLQELLSAAMALLAGIGVVATLLVVFVVDPVVSARFANSSVAPHFDLLFLVVGADVLIGFLGYLFSGILFGRQLYGVRNLLDIVAWLINAAVVMLFIDRGGIVLLAVAKAGMDCFTLIGSVLLCRRYIPGLRLGMTRPTAASVRELLGFGGKIFVSATATRIAVNTQPVIISFQESAAATAFYAIPNRLANYTREIVWALSTGFMPMFSELQGRSEVAVIRTVYYAYSRYILFLFFPMIACLFVYGRGFIALWIGQDYALEGGHTLMVLTAAALMDGLQPLMWRLFMGIGELDFLVAVRTLMSGATIALSLLLIRPFGIEGVAYSVLITAVASQLVSFGFVSRYLQATPGQLFARVVLPPLLVGSMYCALLVALSKWLGQESYRALVQAIGLSVGAYLPMTYLSLRGEERRGLVAFLSRRFALWSRR